LDLNALADQLLVIAELEKKAFKHMRAQA